MDVRPTRAGRFGLRAHVDQTEAGNGESRIALDLSTDPKPGSGVTDGAGSAAKEGGHLGASLRKAKDVVNEEEHVLMLLVAEILGDREAGKGYAQAGARRFVQLSIHQSDLRPIDVRGGTSR